MVSEESKNKSIVESSDLKKSQSDSRSESGNAFQDEIFVHRDELFNRLKSFEELNRKFREGLDQDRERSDTPSEALEGRAPDSLSSGTSSSREQTSYGDIRVTLNQGDELVEFTRWSETDTRTASLPGVDVLVKRDGQTSVEWHDQTAASILPSANPEPFVVFAYPDHSTITLDPDGTKFVALADGTTVLGDSTGATLTSFPNELTVTERIGLPRVVDLPGGGKVELPVQTGFPSGELADPAAFSARADHKLYAQLLNGLQAIGTTVVKALELPVSEGNAGLSELVGELQKQVSGLREAVPGVLKAPELSLEDLLQLKKMVGSTQQTGEQAGSRTINLPYGITIRIPGHGDAPVASASPDVTSQAAPETARKTDAAKSAASIADSIDAEVLLKLLEHPEQCGYVVEADREGRPLTLVDAQGRTIDIAYDAAGGVSKLSFSDQSVVTISPDGKKNIVARPDLNEPVDWKKVGLLLEDYPIDKGFGVGCKCMVDHQPLGSATWNGSLDNVRILPLRPADTRPGEGSSIDTLPSSGKQAFDWRELERLLKVKPIENGFDCTSAGCMVDHKLLKTAIWDGTIDGTRISSFRPLEETPSDSTPSSGGASVDWRELVKLLKDKPIENGFDCTRAGCMVDHKPLGTAVWADGIDDSKVTLFKRSDTRSPFSEGSDLSSLGSRADSAVSPGETRTTLGGSTPVRIPIDPVGEVPVARSPQPVVERDDAGRLEQIRSGDQKVLVKYDGEKNDPSGFEIRAKDGTLLASYAGKFEIDEKTAVIIVTEKDKSATGLARIQTRYLPNGDVERSEYNELGLRAKQTVTGKGEDGLPRTLTTSYNYLPVSAASLNDINTVRSVQIDDKGRITETAQFSSVSAVESGKPFIAEQVKYSEVGAWQKETRILTDLSSSDQPKILDRTVRAFNSETNTTSLSSEVDASGTLVKQEIRFNSDGRVTMFTKSVGTDFYLYDIDSASGQLVGVKLNGKVVSDQIRSQQLIVVGQSSLDFAAVQNNVRSAIDAGKHQFLSPDSSASARIDALLRLKEMAATRAGETKVALGKVIQSYEGINAGLNVLSAGGFELKGEPVQVSLARRGGKFEPEKLNGLASETQKALEALERTAKGPPLNEQARTLIESLRDSSKIPPKDAAIRLSELLGDLKSGVPKRQREALFEIQNKLAPVALQLVNDATRERALIGKSSNSTLSELSKDQLDLARLARCGDQVAEKMLIWTDAMKTVAEARSMHEKSVKGIEFKNDPQGRVAEIVRDGFTTRLSYKEGTTQPSAADIFDKFGNKIAHAEGLVRINVRTGDVTVTQQLNSKLGLSRREFVYAAGGRVEKNEFSDTGLRTRQTETIVKLDESNRTSAQNTTNTLYEYFGIDQGGKQVPTDNPLAVRLAVAVTTNGAGQPIEIKNFNNFAGVELDRPVMSQKIERTARASGKQSEVYSFVDTSNLEKPQVVGVIRRTVNHNTGEREFYEESKVGKTSQAVRFDSSGSVTTFTRSQGEDSYSYQIKDGRIESVIKNGQTLTGKVLEQFKKEGEQILAVVVQNAAINSYRSELERPLLDGSATAESRQPVLKDLETLLKRTGSPQKESLSAEIERLKASHQGRSVLESVRSADKTEVTESVSEKGREVIAKDSRGNEAFLIRFRQDGKPDLVRERGGYYWSSADGGKIWTAYQDKDLKTVAKDKVGEPQTRSGEISLVDGNLVQKWGDDSRISIRQPDGTRVWEYPRDHVTGVQKVEIERADKTTVTVNTSNSGRQIVARDAAGKETYTVKLGPDGKPNFTHGQDGYEWLSSDGGRTWVAHKDRQPVKNADGTDYTWKGEVSLDSNLNLREMGKSGHLWIRSPDGTKTTRNPEDKVTNNQRTEIQKPDRTSVTVTASPKGEETVARDSKGEEVYRFRTGPDGKPNYVHETGGFHWRSSDGGKTWVAYDRAPAWGSQDDAGKPVDANGQPVADLSKAYLWKGSVVVDQNYSCLSTSDSGKVSCRRTGGLLLKWNRTNSGETEPNLAEQKVAREFKSLTELAAGPPPSPSANELVEKLGGRLAAQGLLRRLQTNEPGVREAAMKEVVSVLNPATAQAVARDQILNVVSGISSDSNAAELVRIQPELVRLARTGNPQAERWLNWSEAAKNLDNLRQREPVPVAAHVKVVTDASGRPSEIRSGEVVTAKFEYRGDSKVPSSIEVSIPDPANRGKFKTDVVEPNGPVKVDARTGVILFSRPVGDSASLERSDTRIFPDGRIERDVYDVNGLRTERRARELGKPEAELVTRYTYVSGNGRLTENPAAVAMVMAESRNANNEVVGRTNFNSFAAVELNKPALRETIESRIDSSDKSKKVELHTYTDVSTSAAPKRLGESERREDTNTGEVTISGSLVSAGKQTSESAKFKANGEASSFSRQVGETKLDYVLKDGRVINVKVTNPEKLDLDIKNTETVNVLIAEGNSLLERMRDQYNIRSVDSPESTMPAKKDVLDEIARNTNPASGTLILVDPTAWEGGRYQSFIVDAGKILGPDGKLMGALKNNGDVEFADGRKLNVLADEGAMFSGRVGDGSNAIHFNMVKPKRDELNGVIRQPEVGSDKAYRVVNGMVFDDNKFLGHLSPSGRFHFNATDLKGSTWVSQKFSNARFEGTDNSNPPQERTAFLNDDAPSGKIVIPDEKGRAIEYDVRMGMIVNKATGEQIGTLTPPTMHGNSSLSGGFITSMDGKTVPLGNFRGAAFSLCKPSSLARGIAEKDIEGLSLGPQERLADGSTNPETGGLYSVTQARDASELRLNQSREKLREYDDGTHPYDYVTGVRESTVRQLKNAVRLNQRDAETFAVSFHSLMNGKYSEESVNYVLSTLNIARLSTARESISIKKQLLESASSEFESLPSDTTKISGSILLPISTGLEDINRKNSRSRTVCCWMRAGDQSVRSKILLILGPVR
jgi:hypothetical protein